MKRATRLGILLLLLLNTAVSAQETIADNPINIIPKPLELVRGKGHFTILPTTQIKYNPVYAELAEAGVFLNKRLKEISGYSLPVGNAASNSIELLLVENMGQNKEAYALSVQADKISLSAPSKAGLIFGMQSLLQCLPAIRPMLSWKSP